MKAITYYEYGSVDNLELEEVPKPTPKKDELRIKVHAVSINSWDWDLMQGTPFYVRLAGGGIKKPIKKIIGCDVAGVVESVGESTSKFKIGDEVFGDISSYGWGGFAEYVCAKEKAFVQKPSSMSFEEAAAIPQAGVMALQGIRDYREIQSGDSVLINGAGGGVGSFAIQLARLMGAHITAVDRTSKLDFMKSLGADEVIDFTEEDFTQLDEAYDLILDVVGHHSIYDYKRVLNAGGNYRMIGGASSLILQSMFVAPFISMLGSRKMGILGHQPNKGLDHLIDLFLKQDVKPIIDSVFPLEKTREAFECFGKGHVKGKVVICVS
ncbi:MAG: NAD(P)-dependent alcohol dehydrogenase [Cyclobacteriaceae bacterium]